MLRTNNILQAPYLVLPSWVSSQEGRNTSFLTGVSGERSKIPVDGPWTTSHRRRVVNTHERKDIQCWWMYVCVPVCAGLFVTLMCLKGLSFGTKIIVWCQMEILDIGPKRDSPTRYPSRGRLSVVGSEGRRNPFGVVLRSARPLVLLCGECWRGTTLNDLGRPRGNSAKDLYGVKFPEGQSFPVSSAPGKYNFLELSFPFLYI